MSLSDPLKKMSKSDDDPNGCVMLMDDADTVSENSNAPLLIRDRH
jgi:tryptophanyl-tRNA synthetase